MVAASGAMGGPALAAGAATDAEVAAFAASRRFIQTRFGRIASYQSGSGPVALFVHAYPLSSFEWRGSLERLSSRRRCVAVDSMGLGYSEVDEGQDLSPASQADMLAAVLDALGAPDADIVANDSGGAIAQMFCAKYPTRVRSLLLTNCDAPDDNPPASFMSLVKAAQAGTLADKFISSQLADLELARSQRGLGLAYAHPELMLSQATVDYYLKPLVSSPKRRAQFHGYTIPLGVNVLKAVEPKLRQLQAPVKIVWGTADSFFSPASPDALNAIFPKSRGVRRIAEGKLYVAEEWPDVIAEEAGLLWRRDV